MDGRDHETKAGHEASKNEKAILLLREVTMLLSDSIPLFICNTGQVPEKTAQSLVKFSEPLGFCE